MIKTVKERHIEDQMENYGSLLTWFNWLIKMTLGEKYYNLAEDTKMAHKIAANDIYDEFSNYKTEAKVWERACYISIAFNCLLFLIILTFFII